MGSVSGAAFIFLMTLLITIDVLGRAIGMPSYIADEMSGYLLIGIVFLGLGYTQRKGKHIQITILTRNLSGRKRRIIEIATLLLALVFIGWFTFSTIAPVIQNYQVNATSLSIIATPLWIPWLLIPLGLAILAIELIVELIQVLRPE